MIPAEITAKPPGHCDNWDGANCHIFGSLKNYKNEKRIMSALLEVENLEKSFNGRTVVDRVSFSVGEGQVMGMLGPNGAGKKTTIRMIMGVFAPDSGRIKVALDGTVDNKLDKRRIGYLPEERGLYQDARVIDLLVFIARYFNTIGEGIMK